MALDRGGKYVKLECRHDVSSSSSCFSPLWTDLPTDVLHVIADKVDTLGILRLRAVCPSWRSNVPPLKPSIQFPVKLPCPISSPLCWRTVPCDGGDHLALIEATVYRIYPPHDSSNSWLIKVEPTSKPNVFSLLDPMTGLKINNKSYTLLPERINLLNYRILLISKSYRAEYDVDGGHATDDPEEKLPDSLKKVVVAPNFREMSELLVMGLKYSEGLVIWRYGDKAWTHIMTSEIFKDIISYRGAFYAAGSRAGELVKFDSTFRLIVLVPKPLDFGHRVCLKLLESRGELYLAGRRWIKYRQLVEVYKFDDKGSYWASRELDLKGRVFFLGNDGAYAVDKEDYSGCIANCVYFVKDDEQHLGVCNVSTGITKYLASSFDFRRFYWPPPSWVYDPITSFC